MVRIDGALVAIEVGSEMPQAPYHCQGFQLSNPIPFLMFRQCTARKCNRMVLPISLLLLQDGSKALPASISV